MTASEVKITFRGNGLTPEIAAWAAGFFEGEGSICIQRRTSSHSRFGVNYALAVQVSQRRSKPLLVLCDHWGGYFHKVRTRGSYGWRISSAQAVNFLEDIKPYLWFRQELVQLALDFAHTKGAHGKPVTREQLTQQEDFRNKIRQVNSPLSKNKISIEGEE